MDTSAEEFKGYIAVPLQSRSFRNSRIECSETALRTYNKAFCPYAIQESQPLLLKRRATANLNMQANTHTQKTNHRRKEERTPHART